MGDDKAFTVMIIAGAILFLSVVVAGIHADHLAGQIEIAKIQAGCGDEP